MKKIKDDLRKAYKAGYAKGLRIKGGKTTLNQLLGRNDKLRREHNKLVKYKINKSKKEVLNLINEKKEKAIKDICKNMNVRRDTLCQLGSLGLMTVEELVETFYGEELKSKIEK